MSKRELAIRISSTKIGNTFFTTKEFVERMLLHNKKKGIKKSLLIHKCLVITEEKDKSGNAVDKHQHIYIEYSGVSDPIFRRIFKEHVLKMDLFVKHKRGNSIYSVSKLRTNYADYCSYMNKWIELDENPDTYSQNPSWYNFTHLEVGNVLQSWLKSKSVKSDFKENKKLFGKAIQELQTEFEFSLAPWVKNRSHCCSSLSVPPRNLTYELLKLYIKFGVSWQKYRIESKVNLWYYTKYPNRLKDYAQKLF